MRILLKTYKIEEPFSLSVVILRVLSFLFLRFYLFIERERESKRKQGKRQRQRERENLKQAPH